MSLHYKKDGSLDMRYASSKAAVRSSGGYGSSGSSQSSGLHYKKDGSLDMRFKSSKEAVRSSSGSGSSKSPGLHYNKDGSLDRRFKTSKEALKMQTLLSAEPPPPEALPRTKTGKLDLRFRAVRDYLQGPTILPRKKDGSLDMRFKACRDAQAATTTGAETPKRKRYWRNRMKDSIFLEMLREQRKKSQPCPAVPPPSTEFVQPRPVVPPSNDLAASPPVAGVDPDLRLSSPCDVVVDKEKELGAGSFGAVYLGTLKGESVAVKVLNQQCAPPKRQRRQFEMEMALMAKMGSCPNVVKLLAYFPGEFTLTIRKPPMLVMEYCSLGSLDFLINYCEEPELEAKFSDGRVKKALAMGIANGMASIHACGIAHRDLKPSNVLVNDHFVAKIADFGLSVVRSRSLSQSSMAVDDSACGTILYMAPELFRAPTAARSVGELQAADVYSFGVLLNELLVECTPFTDRFVDCDIEAIKALVVRGERPAMATTLPEPLKAVINQCWADDPKARPSFECILAELAADSLAFPDSEGLDGWV